MKIRIDNISFNIPETNDKAIKIRQGKKYGLDAKKKLKVYATNDTESVYYLVNQIEAASSRNQAQPHLVKLLNKLI